MKDVLKVIEFEFEGVKHSKSVYKTPKGNSRYENMSDEDIVASLTKVLTQVVINRKRFNK